MKYIQSLLLFLSLTIVSYGQVNLGFTSKEIGVTTTFDLEFSLNNQQEVRALQIDFSWDPEGFDYLNEVTASDRLGASHSITISKLSTQSNQYRMVVFSADNTPIEVGEGPIVSLRMQSSNAQGNYPISITNVVLSDNDSQNISALEINEGVVTVLAPAFREFSSELNFGGVYKGTYVEQELVFENYGTAVLTVTLIDDATDLFQVDSSVFPLQIDPNSSYRLKVGFQGNASGTFEEKLQFSVDDPLIDAPITITFKSQVYSDNIATLVPVEMESNSSALMYFNINTEEAITSLQFDVYIPEEFTVVTSSIQLLNSTTDHLVSSSFNTDTRNLRILSYSATNSSYAIQEGSLLQFRIQSNENMEPKSYPFELSNVVMNNLELFNVVTQVNGTEVVILGSKLAYEPELNLGNLPFDYVSDGSFVLRNSGTTSLRISALESSSPLVKFNQELPFDLEANEEHQVDFQLTPDRVPDFDFEVYVTHDAYNKKDTIAVQSTVFYPNFIQIEKTALPLGGNGLVPVQLVNYQSVIGMEFSMQVDPGFDIALENIQLAPSIEAAYTLSIIPDSAVVNKFKVLVYSLSNSVINPGITTLFELPIGSSDLSIGNYDVVFSDLVISSSENKDISSEAIQSNQIGISIAPQATTMNITVDEQIATTFEFEFINEGGLPISVRILNQPTEGSVTVSGTFFTYESNSDTATSDAFTFSVSDGIFNSEPATVSISINPINDAPRLVPIENLSFSEDTAIDTKLFDLIAIDPDSELSSDLNFSIIDEATKQLVAIRNDNEVYLIAPLDYESNRSHDLVFEVADSSSSDSSTQLLSVLDVPNTFVEKSLKIEVYDVLFENNTSKVDYSKYFHQTAQEGQTVIYEISGGFDQEVFQLNAQTGALSFKEIPDYENPIDHDVNNIYEVTIKLTNIIDADERLPLLLTPQVYAVPEANSLVFEALETLVVASEADSDGDGIVDLEDNCPLTANADQSDQDGDGIGDVCDDSDQDGIVDIIDSCPISEYGVLIDTNGCELFSLPQNNYSLAVTSATCVGSNNGVLEVSALNPKYTYHAILSGQQSQTLSSENNYTVSFDQLDAGIHNLCITVDGEATYEQCFQVQIKEPESIFAKTAINYSGKQVSIELDGASLFHIQLNEHQFTTSNKMVILDLKPGMNTLEVVTDALCQGTYFEQIFVSEKVLAYPNPVQNQVQFYVGGTDNEVALHLYPLEGSLLFSEIIEVPSNRVIEFDFGAYAAGLYVVQLTGTTIKSTIKLLKE